jgi:hypothetical protein
MFANLDCMHYRWKICPITWQGQFQDKNDSRLIILEVVIDQSLWIWHVFFNLPSINNDINVLDRSPLITNLLKGLPKTWILLSMAIHIQNNTYLLMHFSKMQEGTRKDVER